MRQDQAPVLVAAPLEQPLLTVDGELLITPFYADDARVLLRAAQDPEMVRQLGLCRPLPTISACADWLAEASDMAEQGVGLRLAVRDRQLSLVGCVELSPQPSDVVMIGYWTASWTRGRGIATRAAGALCDWARGHYPDAELTLATLPENHASEAVARRLGFVPMSEEVVDYPGRGETLLRFWTRW